MRFKKVVGLLAAVGFVASMAISARADLDDTALYGVSYGQFGRTIEINVGTENAWGAGGERARVAVGIEYLGYPIGASVGNLLETLLEGKIDLDIQYVGRIRADLGVGVGNGVEGTDIDSYNVSVGIFAQDGMEINAEDQMITLSQGQLGVVKFSRDRVMNEEQVFIVRVLDSRARVIMGSQGDAAAFYVGAALRGLGYRMKDYVEGDTFHGFELAGAGGELGVLFALSRQSTLELGVGGDADVAFGVSEGGAVQSDMNAFGTARYTLRGDSVSLQVSADGGYRYTHDTGNGRGTGAPFVGTRMALWF